MVPKAIFFELDFTSDPKFRHFSHYFDLNGVLNFWFPVGKCCISVFLQIGGEMYGYGLGFDFWL